MSFVIPNLDHPGVETIGWSLVHFVWQGLAIAALLAGVLSALGRTSAHTRYLVECCALVLMALCPLVTCFWLTASSHSVSAADQVPLQSRPSIELLQAMPAEIVSEVGRRPLEALPGSAVVTEVARSVELPQAEPLAAGRLISDTAPTGIAQFRQTVEAWLPWLVMTWVLGVLGLSARLVTGWYLVQRIRRLARVPSADLWVVRCRQLADRLGIRQRVKLVESVLIEVPSVIGWLRPTILLPVSALTGLEPSQLEAILVHELAHIRRHDYLVNLAQTLMETLLFYHPAVWWVSRMIRNEREHCCDDLAVEICGNRIEYARALAEMESLRTGPRLTVAATDGSLMFRIRRLVIPGTAARRSRARAGSPIAVAIAGILLAAVYFSIPTQADAPAQPQGLVAELPGGIKVELLGVSATADEARWWQADGRPLEKNPLPHITYGTPTQPLTDWNRFALRITGLQKESTWAVVDDVAQFANTVASDITLRDMVVEGGALKSMLAASVRVRVHHGEFGPPQIVDPTGKKTPVANLPEDLRAPYDAITSLRVDEAHSQARISLPVPDARYPRQYPQWTAIDVDGREIPDGDHEYTNWQKVISFNVPLARVARFEYRLRPYEHWVTFANISLQADRKIQPVVTVDGPFADRPPRAQVEQILNPLIARAEASRQSIKTAHVKFRVFNRPGPYKSGITPAQCADLLKKYDLVKNAGDLRKLVLELFEAGEITADPPWTESELYMDGLKFREERSRPQGEPDVHITDDNLSLHWDAANSQVDIQPMALGFRHRHTLDDFRQPAFHIGGESKITHQKDQLFVTSSDAKTGWSTDLVVDETTGFQVQRTFRQRDLAAKPGDSSKESYWLGWQAVADGIAFPKLVVDFHFIKGQLQYSSFMIVTEVTFNSPLSGSLFQLSAPAGSVIVDRRKGADAWGQKINYDVFDVTSEEQVFQAIRNLPKEPATPEDKFALAELMRLYLLADDQTLKRIKPPFPLSRKYIHWMTKRNDVPARRSVHFDLIAWKDNKVEDTFSFEGLTPTLEQLIFQFLKFDFATIEGDRTILQRELAGDYLYRRDAAPERLADRLAQIASDEFGIPLKLSIREVERPTLVVHGKLKLREGMARVALNGGPHTGDYGEKLNGGQLAYFLQEVGRYIRTPVVDETGIVNQPLVWSERWYDLKTTKPEKRFRIDPAFVLKQITEQTGLTFTKETRKVRMLFVDAVGGPRPVTPQAQAAKKPLTDAEIQAIQRLVERQVDADAMVSIKGQVHDEAGEPVAGADLVLPLLYDNIGQTIIGKSDASGHFELQAPKKLLDVSAIHSSAALWCTAPGKQAAAFRLFNQPLEKVIFKLETAGEVPFQVTDTTGKPVVGAIVEPRLFVAERYVRGESTTYYSAKVPEQLISLLTATTDSAGRGRFTGLAARDLMSVYIKHDDFGTQGHIPKRNEGDPTIRWELLFPGKISGQVKCDAPDALQGLKLKLVCKNGDLGSYEYHLEDVEVPVEADGRFEFAHVFPGVYQIVSAVPLNGEWMLRHADKFWVHQKATAQIEMRLERALAVTGLVKDRVTGLPVPDVTVHLETMEGSGWGSVKTDSSGRYHSRALAGRVKVRANPMNSEKWFNDDFRNGQYTERIWSVKPGSEPVEMPVLDVISTIAVKGQLIGQDQQPLEYVAIDALDADGNSVSLGGAYTQRYGVFQMRIRESAKIASYQLGRKGRENSQTHSLSVENQAPLVLRSLTHKKQPSSQ